MIPSTAKIIVLSSHQLGYLAEKSPEIFLSHYRVELDDFVATVRTSIDTSVEEDSALRLALIGAAHESSDAVRTALYQDAILIVLRSGPLDLDGCARRVSGDFRLGRMLPANVLLLHFNELETKGEIARTDNGQFTLTELGGKVISEHEQEAKDRLLFGRLAIRERIEVLIGHALSDDHFERIWSVFRQRMALAFFNKGQQLLRQVSALLSGGKDGKQENGDSPLFFVDDLAEVVAATSDNSEQREELRTAVHDLFEEHNGPTFEWLAMLCASYVALCALGIEAQSGKAIAQLLAKITLVLDTDIALSLLCEGEPNHEEAQDIVRKWQAFGGSVLIGREVLQEVAHHAVIAHYDFDQVQDWLPGTREQRLRIITNAFVRAFAELLASGKVQRRYWEKYIGQFTHKGRADVAVIAEILIQEFKILELPAATSEYSDLENRARALLEGRLPASLSNERLRIAKDKARRDASLYTAIVRQSRSARMSDTARACILISSARRLAVVEQELREVGEPKLVISLGAAFYLVSLIPGVSIGVGAMQTLLFEVHKRFSNDLQMLLLRVVEESDVVSLPWARRHRLVREVRNRLLEDASRASSAQREAVRRPDPEDAALTEKNLPRTVEILREALDAVVVGKRLQDENAELRAALGVMQKEIDRLKTIRTKRRT